jgi:hypothetical protein
MIHELFNFLAVEAPDWEIPWAGIGALMLGVGSTLSGIAAIITARNRGRDETKSAVVSQPHDDGGSGVSDSDGVQPERNTG